MDSREKRIEIFEGTRKLCEQNETLKNAISESVRGQKIYWENESIEYGKPMRTNPAKIVVSSKKTVEAAKKYSVSGKRVCILNFASSVSPGGGVVNGAQAQEESICRVSTLYFALSDKECAEKFYDYHWDLIHKGKMNRKNRDDIVYTPGVVAVRDDASNEAMMCEEEWYCMDVVTCAAPDIRKLGDDAQYSPDMQELTEVFEIRWSKIMEVCAKHEADVVILGAFGCGVFANPPALVAGAFANVYEKYSHYFDTVEFAVYTTDTESENYVEFLKLEDMLNG